MTATKLIVNLYEIENFLTSNIRVDLETELLKIHYLKILIYLII